MEYRINMHSRTYTRKITDRYRITIQENTIHIYLHMISYMYIFAIIDKKGC